MYTIGINFVYFDKNLLILLHIIMLPWLALLDLLTQGLLSEFHSLMGSTCNYIHSLV